MKRKSSKLHTIEEADQALRILGENQRAIAALEAEAQEMIDAIKGQFANERRELEAAVKSTTRLLAKFVQTHADEIEARGRGKTVRLTFGRLGTRTAPPALKIEKGFTEADVIAWLRREFPRSADAYIRTTERIDREALKLWDDADLAKVGLRVEQDEVIVIEPAVDVPASEVA